MSPRGRAVLVLLWALGGAPAAGAAVVDYLYVSPGVDGSSGGHVAVRFGDDRVYHFQHGPSGILRLTRDGWEHFRWVYTVLGNRGMRVARLAVSSVTYERLLTGFNERYLAEEAHVARLAALRDDVALVRRLRDAEGATIAPPFALRGAGFFYGADAEPAAPSAVSADLRAQVRAAYGAGFLAARLADIRQELAHLAPDRPPAPAVVSADAMPASRDGFAERWTDLALEWLALRALDEARPLRPEARLASPADGAFVLSAEERQALAAAAERLRVRLVQLVVSERPDWGFAFLLGLARLHAFDESARTGRLVVLDAFPAEARTLPGAAAGDGARFLAELRADTAAALAAARRDLVAGDDADEPAMSRLEEAANRFAEVARGTAEGGRIRVDAGILIPARGTRDVQVPAPVLDGRVLAAAEAEARAAERAYARGLARTFGYDLLTHNCATEVFATIDAVLGRQGSVERLGGWVDPRSPSALVPLLSFHAVLGAYDLSATGEVPSYRAARLEKMYAGGRRPLVYLRESNTLTSTLYRRTGGEPLFLFFTDDALLLRPLYGVANLAAGLGETLVGVAGVPWDGGRTVWSGVRAIASSLPELVFVSLRKGAMQYARGAAPGEAIRLRAAGS